MDKKLQSIIKETLKSPNPRCPDCKIEGIVKGWGELAWCECPECGQEIGSMTIM